MDIEKLKSYANKLMFDMKEDEYETLALEFDVILKQMDVISKFDGIDKVKPMVLPFDIVYELRDDEVIELIDRKDVLKNAKEQENEQVKVPKVV